MKYQYDYMNDSSVSKMQGILETSHRLYNPLDYTLVNNALVLPGKTLKECLGGVVDDQGIFIDASSWHEGNGGVFCKSIGY